MGRIRMKSIREFRVLDAVIVADFSATEPIIGPGGWIAPRELAQSHPETTVIQLIGEVDANGLAQHRIRCVPTNPVGSVSSVGRSVPMGLSVVGLWRQRRSGWDSQEVAPRRRRWTRGDVAA